MAEVRRRQCSTAVLKRGIVLEYVGVWIICIIFALFKGGTRSDDCIFYPKKHESLKQKADEKFRTETVDASTAGTHYRHIQ